ncbi:hypothetical protein CISG_04587 [Coccidioides immitis RMSCC 3703]|uniref:Uncharacterized protein n=2 Tax=Coccidioides immitis TaxID=5501 RepID=A0A0J8TKQ0_COCIT|nr:hypothetical protein CIRG_01317 [Coccidioides immitis RMSCC 2394]KMU74237.1 hypothetical protein CISG_04587 [Coccidioides immitis RMSCC 3703]
MNAVTWWTASYQVLWSGLHRVLNETFQDSVITTSRFNEGTEAGELHLANLERKSGLDLGVICDFSCSSLGEKRHHREVCSSGSKQHTDFSKPQHFNVAGCGYVVLPRWTIGDSRGGSMMIG